MPTTSILALLDTLDGLHGQATPVVDGGIDRGDGYLVPADNDIRDYLWFKAGEATTPEDMEFVMALAVAYPRLAQALRTVLTPTTGGEREAREALAVFDLPRCGRSLDWVIQGLRCNDVEGHAGSCSHDSRRDVRDRATVVTPEHLRTARALLAIERAKAADADLLVAAEAVANSFNVGGDSIVSARTMTALRTAIARARGKDPT